MSTTATITSLPEIGLPHEMRGMDAAPGSTWSVHFFGEAAGTVLPWDGRSAADLLAEDVDEAAEQGCGEADLEVLILLVTADGVRRLDEASC